uniref:Ribonuclease H-like domain-containing protein n=1 Tax=Tanacetum cinerariifolium TaxID=118510 RepID=A0A699H6I5_TANCI|nr:ribonuclease H-like domain-containing protein [Tanacetum cinerariifolium]
MMDYALWEVLVNGDSPPPKRTVDGVEQTYPPTTAKEKLARKNEIKIRGTLLMALPNKHQLKFNSYKNAKSLMKAIEKRFGGNKELKKTQKTLLKQQYENFNGSSSEGLNQTYDSLQKLISQLEILGRLEGKLVPMAQRPFDLTKQKWNDITIKKGHFAKECRGPRKNMKREPVRRNVTVETTDAKALLAQDRIGYDWSDQAEDRPTNFALMAYTSSGSSSSSNSYSEVSTCSKACLKSYETLKEHYDNFLKVYKKSKLNVGAYKIGLEYVEVRLVVYKKNWDIFEENIKILKLDIHLRDNALTEFRNKLEKAKKERDEIKITLEKFENSSKTLNKMLDSQVNDKYKTSVGYHVVPLPYTRNFMPPKPDLILADVDEYVVTESITYVHAVATNKAKTSEFKIWKMRIEQYFLMMDYALWEVLVNGDSPPPKRTVDGSSSSSQNSQNVALVSSNSYVSTNQTHGSNSVNIDSLSDSVIYSFFANQSNSPQLDNEDLQHIHADDLEDIDLKGPRKNRKREPVRRNVTVETTNSKALLAQDRIGYDWSDQAEDGPTNFALMAYTSSSSSSSSNSYSEVKGVIDSECSGYMTENMSYLSEYEEINGGYVTFGGDPKGGKITSKGKISTDHLGKFDGKADEGFFVGYSVNSKAVRVFNSKTRIVEETLHITVLEINLIL